MDIVRTLATSVLFAIVLAQDSTEEANARAGKLEHSIKLPCRLPFSQPPKVRWEDRVYASTPEPILIFESQNNPNFSINSNHPNSTNYRVDRNNFDLKIAKLSMDDVGKYMCISDIDASTSHKQTYYLSIYETLECSGETQLQEGDDTTFRCIVYYSGKQPNLTWFRAEKSLNSVDLSGFLESGLAAVKDLELNASDYMDGKTFRCRMQLGDKEEECHRLLNVTYPVRDIGFKTGDKGNFYVGEEVTCTARGNPTPEISLVPTSLGEKVDDRKKSSIIIPNSWVGTEVSLECTATNTFQGQEKVVRKSMSIRVLEPTTTTTTTTMKSEAKNTPKAAGGGGESLGKGLTGWKGFPLIMLSVTLMKLIAFCC